jgi:hypothetical protein
MKDERLARLSLRKNESLRVQTTREAIAWWLGLARRHSASTHPARTQKRSMVGRNHRGSGLRLGAKPPSMSS